MSLRRIEPSKNASSSVTNWLDELRESGPNDHLQREIWNRYFRRLAAVARKHMSPNVRRAIDEDDVALSVLNSFFANLTDGRYPLVADRNQLWKLLTTIATYKAINVRNQQTAKKRGGGNVRGDSALFADSLSEFVATSPGPQELAEFKELVTTLLKKLDPLLQRIAHERLIGKSEAEIADQLDVSPRTIRRKLTRIRTEWQAEWDFLENS